MGGFITEWCGARQVTWSLYNWMQNAASTFRRRRSRRNEWERPVAGAKTRRGTAWVADVLLTNRTPALLLVGSLDERWLLESYLFTDYMRRHRHPDYEWVVFEDLGHQLGPEEPGEVRHETHGTIANSRTGPIGDAVVTRLANWIDQRAH